MLTIIAAPNPLLAQSAKRIAKIDKYILKLIQGMKKVLLSAKDPEGVGLAAPQVGKLLQVFIAKLTPTSPISVFINPVIKGGVGVAGAGDPHRVPAGSEDDRGHRMGGAPDRTPNKQTTKLEGCLSLPTIWGEVQRRKEIKLSYLDESGKKHSNLFRGFSATIIQHETDHLNGVLFPKRVLEQKGKLYKSVKDKKGEDVFEEIEI